MFSIVVSQVKFSPIIFLNYLSSGSDFQPSNNDVKIFGAGVNVKYKSKKLNISAEFINHRLYGSSSRDSLHNFNFQQGLSWGASNGNLGDSFDYDFANLNVRYKINSGELFFGKMNPQWGAGHSKVILSDKSPSFPLFGYNWEVNNGLSTEYFHGQLNSLIQDTSKDEYYTNDGERLITPNVSRSIAAHRFIWSPIKELSIICTETVIYGVRGMDFHYLMPLIPFWPLQHYLGDTDNLQMAGEIIYSPSSRLKFYGTIFMDEWAPDRTFKDDNHNWFAYQWGLTRLKLLNDFDQLRLEFTWTDSRIYHHRFKVNDYYSHNYPLGFWAGPHAEEIYISYNIHMFHMDWAANISKAKRGEFTALEDQYGDNKGAVKRYGGLVEEKLFIELEVKKPLYKTLFMKAGVSYVEWKNAGFSPENVILDNLRSIQKVSVNIFIGYQFIT